MGWIKCSERMPEHRKTVLFTSGDHVVSGYFDDGRYLKRPVGKWLWLGRVYSLPVTHWMPLPEPPGE